MTGTGPQRTHRKLSGPDSIVPRSPVRAKSDLSHIDATPGKASTTTNPCGDRSIDGDRGDPDTRSGNRQPTTG
ncbi:hypothetical protein Pen02_38640 [Plantactinospora endophytica]|uniref:Uncharacterized protein n=1 Tax=Plantactinospora endophytica TaxID=673535 RepID=A0ABQ4E2K5_9ACTN|nr:hypothetical protein Pen02_38640 [Plantactinospora endophytica]